MNITGQTIIKHFNKAFILNYNYLLKWGVNDEDLLHEVYEKLYLKFSKDGFILEPKHNIEKKLLEYTKTAIRNTYLTKKKQKSTNPKFKLKLSEHLEEVEEELQIRKDIDEDTKTYQQQLEFFTKNIFQYLKTNYPDYKIYIFKTYYLSNPKNKKINYKTLALRTNYSVSTVCNIIQEIKRDLKKNLLTYIVENQTKSFFKTK